jgi:hypothetical protein
MRENLAAPWGDDSAMLIRLPRCPFDDLGEFIGGKCG